MTEFEKLASEFTRVLMERIGGSILGNSPFGWGNGLSEWMLALCLVVALAQAFSKSQNTFFLDMTRIAFSLWLALAVLGGVNVNFSPFSDMQSSLREEYKIRDPKGRTLDRITFNWLSQKMTDFGEYIMKQEGTSLTVEIANLNTVQTRMMKAQSSCVKTPTAECYRTAISASAIPPKNQEDEKKPDGTWAMISGFITDVYTFISNMNSPQSLLLPLVAWLLEIARSFINFFVILGFGIMASLLLFLTKALVPFIVIPKYTMRVVGLFKTLLSYAFYGFVMNLIIWVSIILTKALSEATVDILIAKLAAGGTQDMSLYGGLLMSNTLVSFGIMVMQIIALTRVPKLCKAIMNLSIEEIASIGEMLLTSGISLAKTVGKAAMVATTAGAGAAIGAAGAMAAKSTTLSAIGQGVKGFAQRMTGTATSSGYTPSSKGGEGPMAFASNPLNLGDPIKSSRSTASAAFDGAPASQTSYSSSVDSGRSMMKDTASSFSVKGSRIVDGDDVARAKEFLSRRKGGATASATTTKTETGDYASAVERSDEKALKRRETIAKTAKAMKDWAVAGAGLATNIAIDGLTGGGGFGDATSTFRGTTTKTAQGVQTGGKKLVEMLSKPRQKDLTDTERSSAMSKVFDNSLTDKQELSGEDLNTFNTLKDKIAQGEATNEEMRDFYSTINRADLNEEQNDQYQTMAQNSQEFKEFVEKQEKENEEVIKKFREETAKGNLSDKTIRNLTNLTQSGLLDTDRYFTDADTSAMRNFAQQDAMKTVDRIDETYKKTGTVSNQDRKDLEHLMNYSERVLRGNKEQIQKIENMMGKKEDLSYLHSSPTDIKEAVRNLSEQLSRKDVDYVNAQSGVNIVYNRDSDSIEGFFSGSSVISDAKDYQDIRTSEEGQKLRNMILDLEYSIKDKEMVKKNPLLSKEVERTEAIIAFAKKLGIV